ncbi:nuclear protein 96-domain-containing protein [Phlebopus sp. FC_14]|nr:nuclear protein 96-domain-containing protein [Phlebopus sp. FC_14]
MARFSALASDSSDEEHETYASQDVSNSLGAGKPIDVDQVVPPSLPDEDEHIEVDGDEVEEEESEETSSEMDEDELVVSRPRPNAKTRNHALVEDSDGEIHYKHSGSRSTSPSSLDSDFEMENQRPESLAVPWAKHVGVDAQKMHVMQTSLFRMPEEAAALQAISRPLRPRFRLSPTVGRKHSRDSLGDGRMESQERASFVHDIDLPVYRPSQKYARVESSASAVAGNEDALVDAGLALGRSFRVGWGPSGTLIHLGQLCSSWSGVETSANSSIVTKTTVPLSSGFRDECSNRFSRLLQLHLSKTPVVKDEDGIPFADPSPELSFSSFISLYPSNDHSYEASVFRLGHALFDHIELHLDQDITVDVRNRVSSIRRKAAFSAWLGEAVTSSVDADLKKLGSGDPADLVFTLLSGNQTEKACDIAMDCGYVKLATLISQASGDFEFREDIREQLQIWREQRIDVHIRESLRKVYSILAGDLDILEGSKASSLERCPDVDPLGGLDWKRTFGMYLWFAEPMDATIAQVYESYNRASQELPSRVAQPQPHYLETSPSQKLTFNLPMPLPSDALFSLIRLYSEPACSLSQVLAPFSFGPSPGDYSFPWHLYIVLSRCMRIRDFSDRGNSGDGPEMLDEDVSVRYEGHSPSADLLASSYAHQLEQLGMLQEAVFVLLHIEGSAGREMAIKDLLQRQANKLDEWMCSGILGSLKIPLAWVNDAKALYAIYQGNIFEAYQLYVAAGLYQAAHDLAVAELAPEAVIQQDFELLVSLFERMVSQSVDGWHVKGKAYMDYAHAMTRFPQLHASLSGATVPDTVDEQELDGLIRSIPKLIEILPDVLSSQSDPRHKVALSEMVSGLTAALDQVRPLTLSQMRLRGVDEATKLRHIQSTALERFMRSIEVS